MMDNILHFFTQYRSYFVIDSVFIIKLAVAMIAAVILGVDREVKMKGIGVKTIMVIFLSATMLTHLALEISYTHSAIQQRVVDPTRIPSYILSSLGFLGAGVILHKSNNVIAGLTTAAMVWAAAAMGILIGFGYFGEALLIDIVIVVAINFVPAIVRFFGPKTLRMEKIRMTVKYKGDSKELIQYLKSEGIILGKVRIKDSDKESNQHSLTVMAMVHEDRYVTDIYELIRKYPSVVTLDIEGI